MYRVSVLLFVLLIPSLVQPFARLLCHMDFQLVSCPFRLRLVILSFRFVGKQLLVFFVRFSVFPFRSFVWHFGIGEVFDMSCELRLNNRKGDVLLTDSQRTKCACFIHGIFRFDTVKTFRLM